MKGRITPYKEGGDIGDRIDEVVMHGADVHFEMMNDHTAFLSLTDTKGVYHGFWFRANKSKLILSLTEVSPKNTRAASKAFMRKIA